MKTLRICAFPSNNLISLCKPAFRYFEIRLKPQLISLDSCQLFTFLLIRFKSVPDEGVSKDFSKHLREARTAAGLSQKDLSQVRLQKLGLRQTNYDNIFLKAKFILFEAVLRFHF